MAALQYVETLLDGTLVMYESIWPIKLEDNVLYVQHCKPVIRLNYFEEDYKTIVQILNLFLQHVVFQKKYLKTFYYCVI